MPLICLGTSTVAWPPLLYRRAKNVNAVRIPALLTRGGGDKPLCIFFTSTHYLLCCWVVLAPWHCALFWLTLPPGTRTYVVAALHRGIVRIFVRALPSCGGIKLLPLLYTWTAPPYTMLQLLPGVQRGTACLPQRTRRAHISPPSLAYRTRPPLISCLGLPALLITASASACLCPSCLSVCLCLPGRTSFLIWLPAFSTFHCLNTFLPASMPVPLHTATIAITFRCAPHTAHHISTAALPAACIYMPPVPLPYTLPDTTYYT